MIQAKWLFYYLGQVLPSSNLFTSDGALLIAFTLKCMTDVSSWWCWVRIPANIFLIASEPLSLISSFQIIISVSFSFCKSAQVNYNSVSCKLQWRQFFLSAIFFCAELSLQQAINVCRIEEKAKLFPEDSHDPYFDGDGIQLKTEPETSGYGRGRKRKALLDFR